MSRLPVVRWSYATFASALVALCFALGAEAAGPKRVLVLHSFGRDFAPYDTIATVFRTDGRLAVLRLATPPASTR